MLLRTWMITWKEFKQISRDPRMLTVVILIPLFMLLLYGYAINLDVTHLRLAVYDQDRSRQSREVIAAFTRSGYYTQTAVLFSHRDVAARLDNGSAQLVLSIPPTFSADLANGRTATVQLLIDGSDSTVASTAIGYATQIIQEQSMRMAVAAIPGAPVAMRPIELRSSYRYNPELRSTDYIVPALIAVILMMLSALLTSVTVVRERERGTIEQLLVSPVRPIELMLGKLIPYVVIAFGDVLLVMLAGALVFHVPLRGSLPLALLLSAIFVTAALGIGMFISTVARNQQTAMIAAMLTTQLPTVLLSGFMFPISSMPKVIQLLTNIIPASHFIRIMRGIFLKGNGLDLLWKPSLLLLAIAVAMLLLSAGRFKKSL